MFPRRALCILLAAVLTLTLLPALSRTRAEGQKLVALTFDDGPSKSTGKLLDTLKKYDAHATFFVAGYRLAEHSQTFRRIIDEGHEVANHTQNHKILPKLGDTQLAYEINTTLKALQEAAGDHTYLMRPPGGALSARVQAAANGPIILWSLDTFDWKHKNVSYVTRRLLSNVRDGDIVLLHDLHATSVDAACACIPQLQARGFELVTVSELFRRRGITPESGVVYNSARGTGCDLPAYVSDTSLSVSSEVPVTAEYENGAQVTLSDEVFTALGAQYTKEVALSIPDTPGAQSYALTFDADAFARAVVEKLTFTTPMGSFRFTAPVAASQTVGLCVQREDGGTVFAVYSDGLPAANLRGCTAMMPTKAASSGVVLECRTDAGYVTLAKCTAVSGGIAGVLTESTMLRVWDRTPAFRDGNCWASDAVTFVAARGLFSGVSDNSFGVYEGMTRAMIVTVLWRAEGKPVRTGAGFSDVKPTEYYTDAVAWAAAEGLVSGFPDGTFRPDARLTRDQLTVILYNYARLLGYDTTFPAGLLPSCATWAETAYAWASGAGIVRSDDAAWQLPSGAVSRAEAALLLQRTVRWMAA
ncbi:MAG: polysaccharide deacetylase family protein [Clostridiales bacterium]|nr:polysaccharide deacetylase family protein [Clostridiales bacterium]